MSDPAIWLTIAGLALATYGIRFSFLGLLAGRSLPEGVVRALGFVPVTVLPALIAPMVFLGREGRPPDPSTILAAACCLVAGLATRTLLAGILGGIAGYGAAILLGL